MSDFSARIIASLDTSKVESQLQKLNNTQITLRNISVDADSIAAQIKNAIGKLDIKLNIKNTGVESISKQITNEMSSAGESAGKAFGNTFTVNLNKSVLEAQNAKEKIEKSLQIKGIQGADYKTFFDKISQQAENASIKILKVSEAFNTFGKGTGNLKRFRIEGLDSLNNAVHILDTFDAESGEMVNSVTTITKSFTSVGNAANVMSSDVKIAFENVLNTGLTNGKFKADLDAVTTKFNQIGTESTQLSQNIQQLNDAFNAMADPNNSLEGRVEAMKEYLGILPGVQAQLKAITAEETAAAKAASLDKARNNLFTQIQDSINKLTPETQHFKTELENIQNQIEGADRAQLTNLTTEFNKVTAAVKEEKEAVKEAAKEQETLARSSTLSNNIQTWMNNNKKAAQAYGDELVELQNRLKNNTDASELKQVGVEFRKIQSEAKAAGLTTNSFANSMKNFVLQCAGLTSAVAVFHKLTQAIKDGVNTIVDLDTALVDLQKTTTATTEQLESFYYQANDIAKSYGATTQEIIQSAADWSRLGYSLEDAETMSQVSSLFKSISPGLDIEEATDGLVSAMKAFNIEANDALDGIASKINAIGNSQAVSNEDIVNFLTRSSSAMKEANNTLDETIALGTAATEVTRDAASVGTALRTVSMRIRGYDEETEEYVGGLEELSGDIADLTKTAEHPLGITLFTDADKTEYKSTIQLLRDISEIYDELTDKQQANNSARMYRQCA